MTELKVLSNTQRITVNPATGSIGVTNAGPVGPTGATGPEGLSEITLVSYTVFDDMGQPLLPSAWVPVTEVREAEIITPGSWSIGAVIDRIGPSGAGYTMVGVARKLPESYEFLTTSRNVLFHTFSQNATFSSTGNATVSISGSGVAQNAAQNSPRVCRLTAQAAGIQSSNPLVCRGANTDWVAAGFGIDIVVRLPDASYNETGAGTGCRMLFGLSSSGGISTVLATDTLGATQIGFYRRHVNGGAQDANWLIATRDGATQATIDTGLAFVTNEWLRFQLSIRPGGTTVYWRITRLSANLITEGAWTPSGAGLPTAGVVMGLIAALYGIDVANRNIDVLRATLTA